MGYGKHWEWRGFGGVSSRFADKFNRMPEYNPTQTVEDLYIWVPDISTNIKIREGAEDGLKIKRYIERRKPVEKWEENPNEIFKFPLSQSGWTKLQTTLAESGIEIPAYPSDPDREKTLDIVKQTGCKTVRVCKKRDTRLFEQKNIPIQIEWTVITEPQSILSIGLENINDDYNNTSDKQAIKAIQQALYTIDLVEEPLSTMNYMEAIAKWAVGNKI